jgi:hypothetical protein
MGPEPLPVYLRHLIEAERCRSEDTARHRVKKIPRQARKGLVIRVHYAYLSLAQFRTCLWSRAGWWASGQEAGQPPESTLALDTPNRQPEAKTGAPRSQRGTRLKATTNGLFWSRWPSKGQHRRGLFIIARRADGNPPSNPRQHLRVKSPSRLSCLHRTKRDVIFPR